MKLNLIVILIFSFVLFAPEKVNCQPETLQTRNGKSYLVESSYNYTWFEAMHECAKRNSSLVTWDTPEKSTEIVALLKQRFGKGVDLWIGATVSTAENTPRKFVWTWNGKKLGFSHWQAGEPNNLRGEQVCVHTWAISPDFRWADGQWYLKYGYICEENPWMGYIREVESKMYRFCPKPEEFRKMK